MIERHLREARSAAGEVPVRSAGERPLRFVVADDQDLVRSGFRLILSSYDGFSIVGEARDGEEAVELARRLVPDVVLMDIRMPLMDGLTAANNIRHLSNADAHTVPIIAMTANAFDDDIEKSKAAGMNAHLAKPVDPQRLYQLLYDFVFGKED